MQCFPAERPRSIWGWVLRDVWRNVISLLAEGPRSIRGRVIAYVFGIVFGLVLGDFSLAEILQVQTSAYFESPYPRDTLRDKNPVAHGVHLRNVWGMFSCPQKTPFDSGPGDSVCLWYRFWFGSRGFFPPGHPLDPDLRASRVAASFPESFLLLYSQVSLLLKNGASANSTTKFNLVCLSIKDTSAPNQGHAQG
ncbi:hypothetical protein DFH06DRAFT_1126812 [Mycena polygramma]|nr:hypothetical protein DFH06DRAFT_1126812 [Mycena polygramma]